MKEYSYPFSFDWSTQEVIDVIKFFELLKKLMRRELNEKS